MQEEDARRKEDDPRLKEVVDFLLQRKLNEIDFSSQDLGDRLITLGCGHIFTVETLDGHCGMNEYYEIDVMGQFIATKAPPINYQTPPSCPLCRGPITALRYGRVTKRANLDILEQNVASTMSQELSKISSKIQVVSADMPTVEKAIGEIGYISGTVLKSKVPKAKPVAERFESLELEAGPLPANLLMQSKLTSVHGFPEAIASKWHKITSDLLARYREVVTLANTRGPHIRTYEAALSTLYRLELTAIADDPLSASDAPEPLAMQEVNKKIGQPPHKADIRFQIEAFFLSLELRFMIAQVAQRRLDNTSRSDEDGQAHWHLWLSLVQFIYESCVRDARKALSLAEASSASRLAARANVHLIRAELEAFRFDIASERDELSWKGQLNEAQRKGLALRVENQAIVAKEMIRKAEFAYVRSRPSADMAGLLEERRWFLENCRGKGDHYLEEYVKLKEHVETDHGYQPLSLQEKEDIIKSFDFGMFYLNTDALNGAHADVLSQGHAGHFYNCQNGHTFVITEVRWPTADTISTLYGAR